MHLADYLSYLCFVADLVTYMYRKAKNIFSDIQNNILNVIRIMIIVTRHTQKQFTFKFMSLVGVLHSHMLMAFPRSANPLLG